MHKPTVAVNVNSKPTPASEPDWQHLFKPLSLILCLVTFVEFVVFGAWFSTLGLVLHQNNLAPIIGEAYFISAIAAILSPVLLGAVCDRFIAPKWVLCGIHIIGAVIMFSLPAAVHAGEANLVILLVFAYMLAFQPTLALINSITLKLLGDKQSFFPYIRMFGPLGWVFVGQIIGAMGLSASTDTFVIAAVSGIAMALFVLMLPYTPPPAANEPFSWSRSLGLGALQLFKNKRFAVLMICILLTSIMLGFYNTFSSPYLGALGIENVAGVLSFGQLTEVIFICVIPLALARFGVKRALLFGILMWIVRFALFVVAGYEQSWAAIGGVILHGLCNDFVIVIAAMFIARLAPPELAAQAQGLLILMISGFGAALGSLSSGAIYKVTVQVGESTSDWTLLWSVPIALACIAAFIWGFFFEDTNDFKSES
ncbi:MAG: MFS transporter [Alteromonadaceae bacterium]|jgi:nucleoside transporter|uniref:MFS transporter n=1 Tax=uncultured Paraglaciecola sp. TaxID=1765024 RepID=UPI000C41A449|nr:MFS transporter [Alteromonadaceae bacterium]|tara:strand:+ start:19021 stop:20298 length:1278 start_codon:yes stop_codon:yes gene_type:complete